MVERLAFDLAFLGGGVLFMVKNEDMARYWGQIRRLKEGDIWELRLAAVFGGIILVGIALADLVAAALGRGWLFS
jgi:hypothetical protein